MMKIFSFNKIKPATGSFIEILGGLKVQNIISNDANQVVTKGYVDARAIPIGIPFDYDKSDPDVPDLPDSIVELNGQWINDADSYFYNRRVRNLNGADVILTIDWTADVDGAYATIPTADLYALTKGDDVSGSGVASNTTIKSITGNTVVISDASASGEIETTFNNRGKFIRGSSSSGAGKADAMQRITGDASSTNDGGCGQIRQDGSGENNLSGAFQLGDTYSYRWEAQVGTSYSLNFDSANSTSPKPAKTNDDETYPTYTEMVKVMRIKD